MKNSALRKCISQLQRCHYIYIFTARCISQPIVRKRPKWANQHLNSWPCRLYSIFTFENLQFNTGSIFVSTPSVHHHHLHLGIYIYYTHTHLVLSHYVLKTSQILPFSVSFIFLMITSSLLSHLNNKFPLTTKITFIAF